MNKKEYSEALKSPKWLAKRNKIRKRDNYKCVYCDSKEELHVHHKYYLSGKMPWEVPDECLITLCKVCHTKEHEGKDIKSFLKKNPPKSKPKAKKPPKKEKNRLKNLSKEDRELQKKYDELRKKGKLPISTYKRPKKSNNKQKRK